MTGGGAREGGASPGGPSVRPEGGDERADGPARGAGPPILEGRELVKVYGRSGGLLRRGGDGVAAVRGVSLAVRRGETLALVGESGSGKSTTARLLVGLEAPTSGTVRFEGVPVDSLEGRARTRFRRRVQMIFQDPFGSLNPRLTVGGAIREALRVHGLPREGSPEERAAELLETVGLEARDARRYPHEFSGGQRQRIAVARALSVEPEVLVADEPVSALDVSVQAQILDLLSRLKEEFALTTLFIAHDLAVVRQVADRVAVMYLGRIVEEGPVEQLFEAPLHPYTRALLDSAPRPRPGARSGRRGLPLAAGEENGTTGCPFYPRCPHPEKDEACLRSVPRLEKKRERGHARCIKVTETLEGTVDSPPPEST